MVDRLLIDFRNLLLDLENQTILPLEDSIRSAKPPDLKDSVRKLSRIDAIEQQ